MGKNSKIEWCDHTFNPWEGCSKVSDGCKNCYAEARAKRFGSVIWGEQGTRRRTSDANWKKPIKWNKDAQRDGVRRKVFCASLADVFENRPELVEWLADLINLIMKTPHLDWLLLTKRPENVMSLLGGLYKGRAGDEIRLLEADWPLPNVWIGTSVENQEQADKRIPELLKVPAVVRFLSMEPLLGPVDLKSIPLEKPSEFGVYRIINALTGLHVHAGPYGTTTTTETGNKIDWVIVGGESGHNARPMHPSWARSLRDQCQAAGVPFFFKQWGEWEPHTNNTITAPKLALVNTDGHYSVADGPDKPDDEFGLTLRDLDGNDGAAAMAKVGKHAAGRLLDGREWEQNAGGHAMTIYRYPLVLADDQTIEMPTLARILSVRMWAMIKPTDYAKARRTIHMRGTGHNCDDIVGMPFIGTVQFNGLVFHIFDGGEK